MGVKQISIFLENRRGRLHEVTRVLSTAGINIRALSLADTSDFGILRLIVNNHEQAYKILHENGFTVRETDVVAVEVEDHPGGLDQVLGALAASGMDVEYMYAFVEKKESRAVLIFRLEDVAKATKALNAAGINTLSGEELYAL